MKTECVALLAAIIIYYDTQMNPFFALQKYLSLFFSQHHPKIVQRSSKIMFCFMLLLISCLNLFAETNKTEDTPPPLSLIFHDIGWNILGSLTYNYGMNLVGAGLGTWAFIETGLDWEWRNIAYNNRWLSDAGRPGLYIGYIVPVLAPVSTYIMGRLTSNEKLQITGMALAQSLLITLSIQTPLKMISGRALPGIVTELDHTRSRRTDNFSDEFNWFNSNFIGGWPSGHTANAFAAAATISEIYEKNIWLTIGVYTYAALIGFGVTLDVHWASEALAGALIGYAVGKTVGRSFRKLLEDDVSDDTVSFYATLNTLGVRIIF